MSPLAFSKVSPAAAFFVLATFGEAALPAEALGLLTDGSSLDFFVPTTLPTALAAALAPLAIVPPRPPAALAATPAIPGADFAAAPAAFPTAPAALEAIPGPALAFCTFLLA